MVLTDEAKQYKQLIRQLVKIYRLPQLEGRLSLHIQVFPPDKRRRDLDNLLKLLQDSLCEANLFLDDSQIDRLFVERKNVFKGGQVIVHLREIKPCHSIVANSGS